MVKKSNNFWRIKLGGSNRSGFTIVELLVVIVVIGILAALTIIAYNGIQQKAVESVLQSDLINASKKLELYRAENEVYPDAIDCSQDPADVPNICIRFSSGVNYSYYPDNSDPSNPIFTLTVNKNSIYYQITNDTQPTLLGSFSLSKISTGFTSACGITSDGKAYCWGYNAYGLLGDGSTGTYYYTPTAITTSGLLSGKTILSISTSSSHTCVIASDNLAYCWGRNNNGQLGNKSNVDSPVPVAVNTDDKLNNKTVKAITTISNASSYDHTCVIASDNNAYCWGYSTTGQLGNGSSTNSNVPVAVKNDSGALNNLTIKSLSHGTGYNTCVVASDNNAYCWGANSHGQIGDNSISSRFTPVAVDNTSTNNSALQGKTVLSIVTGDYFACAIASDNNAYCWGYNNYGQLGDNTQTERHVPVAVNTTNGISALYGKSVLSIATGSYHTCAIASDNNAYCWGFNTSGELGNGSYSNKTFPVAVDTTTGDALLNGKIITSISVGGYHTCTTTTSGYAYCWGRGSSGQLGNGNTSASPYASSISPPF